MDDALVVRRRQPVADLEHDGDRLGTDSHPRRSRDVSVSPAATP